MIFMKRMYLFLTIIAIMVGLLVVALASYGASATVLVHLFTGELLGPGDFDRLVFDFTLKPPSDTPDTLTAIGFHNEGTARGIRDIVHFVLWEDKGEAGFHGGEDEKIKTSAWHPDKMNWSFTNLRVDIPKEGKRLFMTVETDGTIDEKRRLMLAVSSSKDHGEAGVYETGDEGIFFASKTAVPKLSDGNVSSGVLQMINTRDIFPPVTYLYSPVTNSSSTESPVRITGKSRERGRGKLERIIVKINKNNGEKAAELEPVFIKSNEVQWMIDWTPGEVGEYNIAAIAKDDVGWWEVENKWNSASFTFSNVPAEPAPKPDEIIPPKETPAVQWPPVIAPPPISPKPLPQEPLPTSPDTIKSWSCGILGACDETFSGRLKGKILLKVEGKGEAFYVNPTDGAAYYLGRPSNAFEIMRFLSLGISEDNFAKLQAGDHGLLARLEGKIVLRVAKDGEAWYLPLKSKTPLYLGRPADAFRIMREQGIGISDSNLSKLELKVMSS